MVLVIMMIKTYDDVEDQVGDGDDLGPEHGGGLARGRERRNQSTGGAKRRGRWPAGGSGLAALEHEELEVAEPVLPAGVEHLVHGTAREAAVSDDRDAGDVAQGSGNYNRIVFMLVLVFSVCY